MKQTGQIYFDLEKQKRDRIIEKAIKIQLQSKVSESQKIVLELKEIIEKGRYNSFLVAEHFGSPSAKEDYDLITEFINSSKLNHIEKMLSVGDS